MKPFLSIFHGKAHECKVSNTDQALNNLAGTYWINIVDTVDIDSAYLCRHRWTQSLCQGSSQDQKEENILALALEDVSHLKTDTDTEVLSLEEILSGDTALPWQQSHRGK